MPNNIHGPDPLASLYRRFDTDRGYSPVYLYFDHGSQNHCILVVGWAGGDTYFVMDPGREAYKTTTAKIADGKITYREYTDKPVLSYYQYYYDGNPVSGGDKTIATAAELQTRLNELGCYAKPAGIDGVLGSASRDALWFFEKWHGLTMSNVGKSFTLSEVNAATISALLSADASYLQEARSEKTIEQILACIDSSAVIASGKKSCCKHIAELLLRQGMEPSFVAGVLGNVNNEGTFGRFEKTNAGTNTKYDYWNIINGLGYYDKYSGNNIFVYGNDKNGVRITLSQLISDLDAYTAAGGKFGIGCIQWTGSRGAQLIKNHYNAKAKGGPIELSQVIEAEMEMLVCELNGEPGYDSLAGNAVRRWETTSGSTRNSRFAALKAAQIFENYVECSDELYDSMSKRYSDALALYNEWSVAK